MLPLGISNNIVGKNKAFAIIRVQPKAYETFMDIT